MIQRNSIGEAWETAVLECWHRGIKIETEYGEWSKDLIPGCVTVLEPYSEPVIHRAIFAWHRKDSYTKEIMEGTEDDRIGKDWWYTYHQRLFEWPYINKQVRVVTGGLLNDNNVDTCVNQVKYIIDKLKEASYSRRAQAVTWNPLIDETSDESPCLQRVWCRVINGKLEMHTYWRSRDLWKAWWLNAYAFIEMQKYIADRLGVEVGKYVDISSSLHIYERDWEQVKKNFLNIVQNRPYEQRFMWPKEEK